MKFISNLYLCCLGLLAITSCSTKEMDPSSEKEIPAKEHSMLAVLWQQNSAEYRALCYQAFNSAKLELLSAEDISDKPFAIVTDIDETVLDNSPYSAMQIQNDANFKKEDWIEWGKLKSAKALPGAIDFFKLADSLGFEVFYISNRYEVQLGETIENMKALGLPNADSNHVFLKTDSSEKQKRRDRVLKTHNIKLYLGDNLSDLSSVFDGQGTDARNNSVDELQADFGHKFIVFPNPMYGDWESKGIYEGNRDWTDQQKDSIRHAKLDSYK